MNIRSLFQKYQLTILVAELIAIGALLLLALFLSQKISQLKEETSSQPGRSATIEEQREDIFNALKAGTLSQETLSDKERQKQRDEIWKLLAQ